MEKFTYRIVYRPEYMSGYVHKYSSDLFDGYQQAMSAALDVVTKIHGMKYLAEISVLNYAELCGIHQKEKDGR